MNQRERLLALAVGALGLCLALWGGWWWVDGQFRTRRAKVDGLEREIRGFKQQVTAAQRARKQLGEYEAQSLPPQSEVSRSLYQGWLLSEVGQAGFTDQQVRAQPSQAEGKLFIKHSFLITGKAALPQVVDLLHSLYSADYLHRITTLILKPIAESKQLDVTIDIDAVAMSGAPEATALHGRPSNRLALKTKADYHAAIVDRNLFGPPNRAPQLSISGSKEVRLGRAAELKAAGRDSDPLDRVQYRLVESAAPEARLDEATGQFTWTPKQLGQYKFAFEAYDDGYPSKPSRREEVVLSVVDPPPAAPVAQGFTGFDQAKFTVLAAVIDVSGDSEIWLHNRTAGKMLKLRVGEEFEIGSIKGVVESIGEAEFTFSSEGKTHRLEKGEVLEQATAAPQVGPTG